MANCENCLHAEVCDQASRQRWDLLAGEKECSDFKDGAAVVDAIPISVIKRAIDGISMADQCDQAGLYSYRLRDALRTVLEWYGSPSYKAYERLAKK